VNNESKVEKEAHAQAKAEEEEDEGSLQVNWTRPFPDRETFLTRAGNSRYRSTATRHRSG